MIDFLLKISPGILTALVGAYFAAKWSVRNFYLEKRWQRKENAYTEIIDALYDLLQYCEIKKEDYGQGSGHSEEREEEFIKKYDKAYWKIKKATDIGTFVVSSKASEILKELKNRPKLNWDEYPSWEIYETDYQYYLEALNKIVEVAQKDLSSNRA